MIVVCVFACFITSGLALHLHTVCPIRWGYTAVLPISGKAPSQSCVFDTML